MANNVSIWLAEILPQLALILMIAGLVLVTILAFTFQRRERDIDKALAVTRNDLGYAQREKQRLDESIINLAKKNQRLQSEVETWKAKHGELYSDFERLYRDGLLERWFMFLKSAKPATVVNSERMCSIRCCGFFNTRKAPFVSIRGSPCWGQRQDQPKL